MGSEHNRLRQKWQHYSGTAALTAENAFFDCFNAVFANTNYQIRKHPREFENLYVNFQLTSTEMSEIYQPDKTITRHGVIPDYAIDNFTTNKTLYVEVKRQDGWIEDGTRSDGRGNAHERSCKFFTPGLLKALREKSNIHPVYLPFWVVFQGNITRDPCRVREIRYWYQGYQNHAFFWRDAPNPISLFDHFENNLAKLLK